MPFNYQRIVRFQDTDAAGVVYFARVLTICHEAYEDSLAASGIDLKSFFTASAIAFPIVHASVDFLRPMFCGDKLLIELVPQILGEDSFTIDYKVFSNTQIAAKTITKHVCIDVVSRKRKLMSEAMRNWSQQWN